MLHLMDLRGGAMGAKFMKGGENTLHKTGGRRNPNRK